jgi:hypothetical protein
MRLGVAIAATALLWACSAGGAGGDPPTQGMGDVARRLARSVGLAVDFEAVSLLGGSGDERWAWLLADVLRFQAAGTPEASALVDAVEQVTGFAVDPTAAWVDASNQLISADVAAPTGYAELKRTVFEQIDTRWGPMLEDVRGLDLRHLSWGGVFPDDRPFGEAGPCLGRGCIPALDEPGVTDAAGGSWYPDDGVVFGVVLGGEARAYPRPIMEVHELVNDRLGGRRFAMPYCTLCGSAQAYYTDEVDDVDGIEGQLVLRTSGLLHRSNKVMVDLNTGSLWDTFTGRAASGPLGAAGVELAPITVETATWGDWKHAHPGTTVVAADGGIGRIYPSDPLGGRDDDGPIFPIGDVDPRLPVQEQVVGVTTDEGRHVAFPAGPARAALDAGTPVELAGVALTTDGGGFRALDEDGDELPAHQAFWFAWSQFRPDTLLWEPPAPG